MFFKDYLIELNPIYFNSIRNVCPLLARHGIRNTFSVVSVEQRLVKKVTMRWMAKHTAGTTTLTCLHLNVQDATIPSQRTTSLLWMASGIRTALSAMNADVPSLEDLSSISKGSLIVRPTTISNGVLCVLHAINQSWGDVSQPCLGSSILNTLSVLSV